MADSGADIRVVVGAQYVATGKLTTNFVFDISPKVTGRYSDGYCFSQNNYCSLAIIVDELYDLYVAESWWSMRESANSTIPINDETVRVEVHYR